jgi:cytochrome P450
VASRQPPLAHPEEDVVSAIPASPIPAHVDRALVRDFDLYRTAARDGDYQAWYHDTYQAPGQPEIFWTTANGGHWVSTRGEDYLRFLSEADLYSSSINVVPKERNFGVPVVPLNIDPPDHAKYRKLIAPAFTPRAVVPLGESARRLTVDLIDGFIRDGSCEFMSDFAYRLPIAIFMNMVGIPDSERLKLLALAEGVVRPDKPDAREPFLALYGFAAQTIAERRANPGDDLLSRLTRAEVDGKPLDDQTLVGILLLLLLGGLDTMAASLGYVVRHLAREPEVRRQLRKQLAENPGATKDSIEELFRRFPVSTLVRVVTKDHEYKAIPFRAGDLVCNYSGAHSLDEREFVNPLAVDLARKVSYHGGFGNGPHRCVGSMLARVELKVFLEEWLARIPEFEVEPGAELHTRPGLVVALDKLPLRWPVQ